MTLCARSMLPLVDGEPAALATLAASLKSDGYGVRTASSLTEGLAQIHAANFDLLVTELHLADGLGLDLIRELRPAVMSLSPPAELTTIVALLIRLPSSMGRWPSPIPRSDSGITPMLLASSVPSA
ncbi:MAG: Response regulator receiver domain, partial [Chloroflexota bacterium]|nr:Response regulator receiver domain [Chloroflexota bacterium]